MAKVLLISLFFFNSFQSVFATSKTLSVDMPNPNRRWTELHRDEAEAIKLLVEMLTVSKTGEKVIMKAQEKAREQSETLWDILKGGDGSLTDTTLVRRFSPSRPDQMVYESKSKVFINRRLSIKDALLDMAHEMTHFAFRKPFNPYQDNFSAKQFVVSTVEGRGGEVDAFLVECKVLQELFPTDGKRNSHCDRVRDQKKKILSKDVGVKEFYRIGKYIDDFHKQARELGIAKEDLSLVSDDDAMFISSAYSLPYPLAALYEYQSIMGRACQNDSKRLAIMRERSNLGSLDRSPASDSYGKLEKSYRSRCQLFDSTNLRASGLSH